MNATERIARFIANTRYEDIPRPVLDATRTIILDGVANVLAGSTQPVLEYIRPDMMPFLDGFRYSAILDSRTTEVCRFLDGKIFKPTDPELASLTPPNHFNCRSSIVPLVVGVISHPPDFKVDPKVYITPAQIEMARSLADAKFLEQEEHDMRGAMGIEGFQVGLFRIVERNGGPVL